MTYFWRRAPVDLPAALLLFMGGVSYLVSADRHLTLPQLVWLGGGLAAMYGLFWGANGRRGRQTAVILIVGVGLFLAAVSPFIVNWNAIQAKLFPNAVYQLFPLIVTNAVHPNIMASALGLLLPLPLALAVGGQWGTRAVRLGLGAIWLIMVLALVLTQSRGGYLATAVAICLVLWLSRHWRLASGVTTAVVLAAAIFLTLDSPNLSDATNPANWFFRLELWHIALQMQADFPFTGVGMGSFNAVAERLYPLYSPNNPGAHNLYLQVGLDLGLPGLIAFLAILLIALTAVWRAYHHFREREPFWAATAVGLFAALVGFALHGLVDGTVWGTRGAILPWLLIGLALALRSEE
jgi:putative inorganic carbon (HCO3(-)) transporter